MGFAFFCKSMSKKFRKTGFSVLRRLFLAAIKPKRFSRIAS